MKNSHFFTYIIAGLGSYIIHIGKIYSILGGIILLIGLVYSVYKDGEKDENNN